MSSLNPAAEVKTLAQNYAALQRELAEAKQTIEAIRDGAVDALVVKGKGGNKIFTLVGADHPYRILLEEMVEGALAINLDGVILFANKRFAKMVGTTLSKVMGSKIQTWLTSQGQAVFDGLSQADSPLKIRKEMTLLGKKNQELPVYFSISKLKIAGQPNMLLCVLASDMTEQKKLDEVLASRKIATLNLNASKKLQDSLEDSINAIASAVETRDEYTSGHMKRVAQLSLAIATELNLPEDEKHGIQLASSIHDIGKIAIPVQILVKPGKLTDIEYMLIQTHVQAGFDILKNIKFPWPIAEMVLQHHERMDGSGYPRGLKGEAILLGARIIAISDVIEAMSMNRPYRFVLGLHAALAEIKSGRGSLYDKRAVDACVRLFEEKHFAFC
jgi:PAS domain S-box-containing protein